ncbi:MAG TPA: hypothetical protein DD420_10200 [Streptomyces sp.]|nr:hypothetical protein [Streptomyces sp.]
MVGWSAGLAARDHVVGDGFPERIRIGALTRSFTPELVDFVVEEAGARERAVKPLPARLVVYFTLAMWLFTSVGCGGVLRELVEHWPLGRGESWRPASTGSLTKAKAKAAWVRVCCGCCSSGCPGCRAARRRFQVPACIARSARRITLHLPHNWPWQQA